MCKHSYSKWKSITVLQGMSYLTGYLIQSRRCSVCGKVQVKKSAKLYSSVTEAASEAMHRVLDKENENGQV